MHKHQITDLIAAASADNMISLLDHKGVVLQTLQGHTAEITALTFSSDEKHLYSTAKDGISPPLIANTANFSSTLFFRVTSFY